MHNYVAAQGSPRREEMRPSKQGEEDRGVGRGGLGTRHQTGKGAGELRKDPKSRGSGSRGDPFPPGTPGASSGKGR